MRNPSAEAFAVASALVNVFGETANRLKGVEKEALMADVRALASELADDYSDELDYYEAASELRRRIGGVRNLESYVASLMAGRRRRNPALRGVAAVGSNMTEVEHGEVTILYSYKTPVAVFVPGYGAFVTSTFHSRTTSTHIGKWLRRIGAGNVSKHPQEYIEKIATEGVYPFTKNPTLAILGNPLKMHSHQTAHSRSGGSFGKHVAAGYVGYETQAGLLAPGPGVWQRIKAISEMTPAQIRAALGAEARRIGEGIGRDTGEPWPNPRRKIAKRVLAIDYVHASDGKKYTHDFGEDTDHGPVCAYVENGGRRVVLEASDGRAIVKDY